MTGLRNGSGDAALIRPALGGLNRHKVMNEIGL